MKYRYHHPLRYLIAFSAIIASLFANAQADYSSKIGEWKTQFPKEDVISSAYKEVVSFSLNTSAGPNDGKVKASVSNEITLVPLKDFIKFKDGLFYNDEMSLDNLKSVNSTGKDVKAEKTCGSYSEENIFHSDSKLCVIKFPLEEKGKSFTYSYVENYKDVKYLTSFYFNSSIPAAERVIEFDIPSWMDVDLREFNFSGNTIEKTNTKENDLTKIVYRLKNAAAYKSEPSSPNHALSLPHIVCVSKAYTSNGQRNILFEGVKDLYGWYHTVCDSIGNQSKELKERVTALTAGKTTDVEKIEAIYYWVQDNIRYIAFENGIMGFKPDAAQNVLSKKYGDCKGKANLLKEMLKIAGYDARLTWIGTSDLPYDYTLPSLAVDNHMICTVILNGKRYFLDGTEEYIAFNDYAQRIQGKQVLIEDGKNYILDRIPSFPADRNKVKKIYKINVEDAVLAGNASIEYNGESKNIIQSVYASERNENKADAFTTFLKNGNGNIEVSGVKKPELNQRQKPLQVSFDLKANNEITKSGNELYVIMDWEKEFSGFEFDDTRKNDYEFSHKYFITTQTELAIPAGYKVEYIPAAFKKVATDYSFEGSFVNKGKSILYTKTIIVSKPIIKKSEFNDWNNFIKAINTFYNDQVVLTK